MTDQPGSTEFQALDDAPPTAARLQAANDLSAGSVHAELLADKDAVITQLRHKLNDHVLSSVREAASQNRRIAELEAQLASCRALGARRKVI